VRAGQGGHEPLHEGTVGLVDHALRFRGDRAEDERTLAGTGDAGEDRQPTFRQLEVDVFEIVLACTLNPDEVVAVGGVPRVRSHGAFASRARNSSFASTTRA